MTLRRSLHTEALCTDVQATVSEGLAQVPTWRLERGSNPRPSNRKASTLPMHHHAPPPPASSSAAAVNEGDRKHDDESDDDGDNHQTMESSKRRRTLNDLLI